MSIKDRLKAFWERETSGPNQPVHIPPREGIEGVVTTRQAVGLIDMYRAIQVIATGISQLPLDVERAGAKLTGTEVPSWVRKPNLYTSRSDFIEHLVISLAATGNAYLHVRKDDRGQILNLRPLNPHDCLPVLDPETGIKTIYWQGKKYSTDQIQHLALMVLPGEALGLGPIQAANTDLTNAARIRDYAARWFTETGQPAGILSTDQDATEDQLKTMRNAWNYRDGEGRPLPEADNPARIRVLSKGMHYAPIFINPKDAQWIEAREYSSTAIARLMGVPSSLMMVNAEGSSMTYQNVEQEWISLTRFTLANYFRKIEEALTALAPLGQTIRFNLEALLRSDTKTRYEAYKIGIDAKFLDPEEVRAIESLPARHNTPAESVE